MSLLEDLHQVQYTINAQGKVVAVSVPAALWHRIVEQLTADEDERRALAMPVGLRKRLREAGILPPDSGDAPTLTSHA